MRKRPEAGRLDEIYQKFYFILVWLLKQLMDASWGWKASNDDFVHILGLLTDEIENKLHFFLTPRN